MPEAVLSGENIWFREAVLSFPLLKGVVWREGKHHGPPVLFLQSSGATDCSGEGKERFWPACHREWATGQVREGGEDLQIQPQDWGSTQTRASTPHDPCPSFPGTSVSSGEGLKMSLKRDLWTKTESCFCKCSGCIPQGSNRELVMETRPFTHFSQMILSSGRTDSLLPSF